MWAEPQQRVAWLDCGKALKRSWAMYRACITQAPWHRFAALRQSFMGAGISKNRTTAGRLAIHEFGHDDALADGGFAGRVERLEEHPRQSPP